MSVGAFSPEFDFDGKHVQSLGNPAHITDQVGISILSAQNKAVVAMTWHQDAELEMVGVR